MTSFLRRSFFAHETLPDRRFVAQCIQPAAIHKALHSHGVPDTSQIPADVPIQPSPAGTLDMQSLPEFPLALPAGLLTIASPRIPPVMLTALAIDRQHDVSIAARIGALFPILKGL
ncbi:hypothetical protein [Paraburkholderia megapolitana]|nr:hypothetical protein [Paraburkholderia megapolitana]QDQ80345.1 hypothetical protein FNZ07_03715 [Paraburkholderia megapolitana]